MQHPTDDAKDQRLGELLARYQELRTRDPAASIDSLRDEAGEDYEALVELAACLDWVAHAPPTPIFQRAALPASTQQRPGARRARWWWLGVAGLVVAGALWGWHTRTSGATERPRSPAEHPRVELPPPDAYAPETLARLARAWGMPLPRVPHAFPDPLSAPGPTVPVRLHDVPQAEQDALRLELARLPAHARAAPQARYIVAAQLVRLRACHAAYGEALQLHAAAPTQRPPLALALYAFWGLGRSDTPTYAALHARYLALD